VRKLPGPSPVYGEFLLRPQLGFGIPHDNVSASGTISDRRPWIPLFLLESVLSVQHERGTYCSNP
jgi:hypothetical protein